ncbi:MAG: DUF6377 domain-containing protein [Prevotellaceae bacterium]|jgi:hypothetical protein|nr:DUF6377 domain-containing protein [Prevotellaceae bacterium]
MKNTFKKVIILIISVLQCNSCFAKVNNGEWLRTLNNVLDNREIYFSNKKQKIHSLKQLLDFKNLHLNQIFEINSQLIAEYEKFQSDSAVLYVQRNIEIAKKMRNDTLLLASEMQLAGLYSTKGLYIESKDLLENINKNLLTTSLLPHYYKIYSDFYSHYGQSNGNWRDYSKSTDYRDSMLMFFPQNSFEFRLETAKKMLYTGNENVEKTLLQLLNETAEDDVVRAEIAFLLGTLYENKNDVENQQKYYTISVVTDVKNCIKDNASLKNLALFFYRQDNVNQAYRLFQAALDDAVFCNVRYRAVDASMVYPVINQTYQQKEKSHKIRLTVSLLAISLLLLIILFALFYVNSQKNKLARARQNVYDTNLKLSELNDNLQETNNNLSEANHIKEEYIAHFFDLYSEYISKSENYRKSLYKLVKDNQKDELYKTLKSNTMLENELEELYKKFDTIFLSLYPTFVEDFNNLQKKTEQITLKQGDLLNNELRVFALIRLGINDNMKIAGFLRYSLSTIYNYRVKARNNAVVSREEFDKRLMMIGLKVKG